MSERQIVRQRERTRGEGERMRDAENDNRRRQRNKESKRAIYKDTERENDKEREDSYIPLYSKLLHTEKKRLGKEDRR